LDIKAQTPSQAPGPPLALRPDAGISMKPLGAGTGRLSRGRNGSCEGGFQAGQTRLCGPPHHFRRFGVRLIGQKGAKMGVSGVKCWFVECWNGFPGWRSGLSGSDCSIPSSECLNPSPDNSAPREDCSVPTWEWSIPCRDSRSPTPECCVPSQGRVVPAQEWFDPSRDWVWAAQKVLAASF